MTSHPEGTEKLIDTRDQRKREREARILRDEKIMQSIRRDQRTAQTPPQPQLHVA